MFRPIYEPRNRAREYCDLAVNIYTGCNHGCTYCYAPRVLRKSREAFASDVRPRDGIVESCKRQIERERLVGKKIMLCFTCDPYPADIDTSITREVIRTIKESGNHVQILTKGGDRARRDFDLLDGGDSFGVSVSTGQHEPVEPNAAGVTERLRSVLDAKHLGITTWVSCEPVIDPEAIFYIISLCWYIDMFRIGKLNHAPSEIDWPSFGRECERLCKKHDRNYYIKEDLRKLMEAETP